MSSSGGAESDGIGEDTDTDTKTTVLVVDDASADRYAMRAVLRRAGHRVIPVASAAEALVELDARLRRGALPDVALVDVELPDMSGFELCRRMRARPPTAALPVVHFSAATTGPGDRTRALNSGGDAYLAMPAEPEEIEAVVRAALRGSRRHSRAQTLVRRLTQLHEATVAVQAARCPSELADAAAEGAARLTGRPAAAFVAGPDGELYRATAPHRGPRALPDEAAHTAVAALIARLTAGPARVNSLVVTAPSWPAGFFGPDGGSDTLLVLARTRTDGTPVCLATPAHPRRSETPGSRRAEPALLTHHDIRTGSGIGRDILSGSGVGTGRADALLVRLAQATALAAEPLLMYQAERQIALTLQRSFLPRPSTLRLPGLACVVRYVPASRRAEIGGDFYAAAHTGAGILTAVGDVAGHSLDAATVMVEIRHALRAYCVEDSDPDALAARLDRMVQHHHPDTTATVCLALVAPDRRHVRIANAGHLPPLLLRDGSAEYVPADGPLLGLGLDRPPPTEVPLERGDRLLMVTDGLIETRGTDLTTSMESLRTAAAEAPTGLDALCDFLLGRFGRDREDDIAMLALTRAD